MTTLVLSAVKDSYVEEGSPGAVHGSDTTMQVVDSVSSQRAVIEFDASALPADAVVSSAILAVYVDSTLGNAVQNAWLYRLATQFNETTVSWTTQPGEAGPVAGPTDLAGSAVWRTWDVTTEAVNRSNFPNPGYAVVSPEGHSVFQLAVLRTREYGTAPTLTITYTRPPTAPGAITEPDDGVTYNASITLDCGGATDPDTSSGSLQYEWGYSSNNGGAWNVIGLGAAGVTSRVWDTSALAAGTAYKVRVRAFDGSNYGPYRTQTGNFTIQHNQVPTAPTPTNPVGGATIDKDVDHYKTWTFNDPDPGDTQSAYSIEDRPQVGGSTDATGWITSTSPTRLVAGGTYLAGAREWRVRTKDSLGELSPWSAWVQYVAAAAPADPAITSHIAGATIATAGDALAWSAPDQDAYQVRKVADLAGSPNPAIVYYDTGTVVSSTTRDHPLTFPVNSRWEHLQVRIRVDGLWSDDWADATPDHTSVRVHVDYDAPPAPSVAVSDDPVAGTLVYTVTNPAPAGTEPALLRNDLHRRPLGDTGDGFRVAGPDENIGSSGSFTDRKVRLGVGYEVRVEALGVNGTSSFSAWTS
jgi:hypothetical protein